MNIHYKFLNNTYIPSIHKAFQKAFTNYHVNMSYYTLEIMKSRAQMGKVNYNLSVGAFHKDELVGFLIVGVDKYMNELCAFDAGTGVIPEFRGQEIAAKTFDFVVPRLKKIGVKGFILEVIQENTSAIKTYKKVGFKIIRDFICYKADISNYTFINEIPNVEIKPVNRDELINYKHFCDWDVSWEYNFSTIKNIQDELIMNGAFINNKCVGYIVFHIGLNWIFMLAVEKEFRRKGIGSFLLSNLIHCRKSRTSEIDINNVIEGHPMNKFLKKHDFDLYTTQYEMKKEL